MADSFIAGSIVVELNGKPLALTGQLRKGKPTALAAPTKIPPLFVGVSRPLDNAISLGTFSQLAGIVTDIINKLGLEGSDLAVADINDTLQDLPSIAANTEVRITDLVIDTRNNARRFLFGFALVFQGSDTKLGPIALRAVGLRINKGGFTATELQSLNN